MKALNALALAGALGLALAAPEAAAQNYRFPINPKSGNTPYITAHRDNASGATLRDYNCGTKTYNGHRGTDIGVGSWAGMDAGQDVVAAAGGRVAAVRDGCFDRCGSPGNPNPCPCADGCGNYVRVDHPNGRRTLYCHMRKNTVSVSVGQNVTCGQKLGQVGSSGNSTGPHLHFEVRYSNNNSDDPYRGDCSGPLSYWVGQGAYNGLPSSTCEGGAPPPPPPPSEGTASGVVFEDVGVGTDNMTTRLSGATVRVVQTNASTVAEGDGANWSFDLPPGSYTIRAEAPGYETATRPCTVTAGATAWCSIGLEESPPPPPPPPPNNDDEEGEDEGADAGPDESEDAGTGESEDADEGTDAGETENPAPGQDAGRLGALDDTPGDELPPSVSGGCQQAPLDPAFGGALALLALALVRRRGRSAGGR